jgi:integrase/recombinase XerC
MPSEPGTFSTSAIDIVPGQKAFSLFTRRSPKTDRPRIQAKLAKPLPKAPRTAVEALLKTAAHDHGSQSQIDWAERDLALILTALLAGLRAEELRQADVGDIRTTDDGSAVIHVKGKGGKDRSVPIEAELLSVIETYLVSRAVRFPGGTKRKADVAGFALSRWPGRAPLFVGRDGERITRGTLQSRIKRAFKRAGPEAQPVPGALVHGHGTPTPPNWPAPTSASTPS